MKMGGASWGNRRGVGKAWRDLWGLVFSSGIDLAAGDEHSLALWIWAEKARAALRTTGGPWTKTLHSCWSLVVSLWGCEAKTRTLASLHRQRDFSSGPL